MSPAKQATTHITYLDFEVKVGLGEDLQYPVAVIRSPAGEAQETMQFPYDELSLQNHFEDLEISLLRSEGKPRRSLSTKGQAGQDFGQALFDALFVREIRGRYDLALQEARRQEKGLRVKLRFDPPELAALPWEFMFDKRKDEYLSLSCYTPIVRYLELPQPIEPLVITFPLRVLCMSYV